MAAPYDSPIPGAANYGMAAANANRAYQMALAKIAANRSQLLRSYGYLAGPNGQLTVDPHNPLGKIQQMYGSQAGASEDLAAAHRASGFQSGYHNNEDAQLKLAQGGEAAQLGQDLTSGLSDLTGQEQQASFDRDQALYQAQLDAAQQAIQNQDFSQPDYSGLDYPDYGNEDATPPPNPHPSGLRPHRPPRGGAARSRAAARRQRVVRHVVNQRRATARRARRR